MKPHAYHQFKASDHRQEIIGAQVFIQKTDRDAIFQSVTQALEQEYIVFLVPPVDSPVLPPFSSPALIPLYFPSLSTSEEGGASTFRR